jgi:hypothetical protein
MAQQGDGYVYPTSGWTDLNSGSPAPKDNQLIRFGWIVVLLSGSGLSIATVGGTLEMEVC